MADLLAPHLKHAGTGAWFEPLSLIAQLPSSATDIVSDEERLAHIHEYIHYLQATSTFFGISRFHSLWWSSSEFSNLLSKTQYTNEEKQHFINSHKEKISALEYLAIPVVWDIEPTIKTGSHYVDTGERYVGVYAKYLPEEGYTRLFPLGADALQESMAMAVERYYGYSEQTYQQAKSANNSAFNYAVGTEVLREVTDWGYQDLWWLSIMLSDIALNHMLPYYAFYYGAQALKELYPKYPPSQTELPHLYKKIKKAVHISEVEEERQKLYQELNAIIARSADSSDTFDKAFVRLLQKIREAIKLRKENPSVFVEHILGLGESLDILDKFHLPCYRVDDRLITTSTDSDLTNAILFLIAQMHYLHCFVDDEINKQCPFYENLDQCQFKRVITCQQAPWQRAADEQGLGCISRFVSHGLGHKAR